MPEDFLAFWGDILFALMQKGRYETLSPAFIKEAAVYMGHRRWVERWGDEWFAPSVIQALLRHPGLEEDRGTITKTAFSPKARSIGLMWRMLRGDGTPRNHAAYLRTATALGFLHDGVLTPTGHLFAESGDPAAIRRLFGIAVLQTMPWTQSFLQGRETALELCSRLRERYPRASRKAIIAHVKTLRGWRMKLKGALREVTPKLRVKLPLQWEHPEHRIWLQKNLGTNITTPWVAWCIQKEDLLEALRRALKKPFAVSLKQGLLEDEMNDCITKKIRLNACAVYILDGRMSLPTFISWIRKDMSTLVRNKGTKTLDRQNAGARTESERKKRAAEDPLPLMDRQFYRIPRPTESVLMELPSTYNTDVSDGVDLQTKVLKMIGEMFSDTDNPELWQRVFEARYILEMTATEILESMEEKGYARRDVSGMLRKLKSSLRSRQSEVLEMFGAEGRL